MPRSPRTRNSTNVLQPFADALLADVGDGAITTEEMADVYEASLDRIPGGFLIPIDRIETWDGQPRKTFDDERIAELATSIAATGLLEPLVVRRDPNRPGHFIILAGHRRLLAARRLHSSDDAERRRSVEVIACVVREVTEDSAFADALVENLVRTDLTRREVMDALIRLQQDYHWSGHQIAARTGRNAGDINEMLRVAKHPILYTLACDEIISVSTAGLILRLSLQGQDSAIAQVRAGRIKTAEEVRHLIEAERHQRVATALGQPATPSAPQVESESAATGGPSEWMNSSSSPTIIKHSERMNSSSSSTSDMDGRVPWDATTDTVAGPDVPPEHTTPEMVVVSEHTRRKAGAPAPERVPLRSHEEVERLARDIVLFVQQGGRLDSGDQLKLAEASAQLTAYLAMQER